MTPKSTKGRIRRALLDFAGFALFTAIIFKGIYPL
jgi:hypothetical protein